MRLGIPVQSNSATCVEGCIKRREQASATGLLNAHALTAITRANLLYTIARNALMARRDLNVVQRRWVGSVGSAFNANDVAGF